jgi:2-hydroxychromene-2-carboxylate isomerase
MQDETSENNEVKMYSDFKSPYAYLAFDPAMALGERFNVRVRWIPFQLRLKGKGERSIYSEHKVKYSYMDARRSAKARGPWIRGPLKVYDTTPAAVGGLFAEKHGRFLDYGRAAFKQFFLRELEADHPEAVAQLLSSLGLSDRDYLAYLAGEGREAYERCQQEAAEDHVFGVPFFIFRGEQFWGHDRMLLVEQRLGEAGLASSRKVSAA